jgi:hypothetical protein
MNPTYVAQRAPHASPPHLRMTPAQSIYRSLITNTVIYRSAQGRWIGIIRANTDPRELEEGSVSSMQCQRWLPSVVS